MASNGYYGNQPQGQYPPPPDQQGGGGPGYYDPNAYNQGGEKGYGQQPGYDFNQQAPPPMHNAMTPQGSSGPGQPYPGQQQYPQQGPYPPNGNGDQDRGAGGVAAGAGAGLCCACCAPILACCACCEILDCIF